MRVMAEMAQIGASEISRKDRCLLVGPHCIRILAGIAVG